MAASRFLNVSEKEIKIRKENAIPRNTKNTAESSDWHFSKIRCENCAKYNKETFLNSLENVAYVDMREQIKTTIKFSQHFSYLLYLSNRMVSTTNRIYHWLWDNFSLLFAFS